MIYLTLFLTFFEVGAVCFGGGYGMVSLVREAVLRHGWLTEARFLNLIAVSESTPGPIAVNIATFVGSTQGGILGSLLATLGVILPAFVIILTISAILKNVLKYAGVRAFLSGIRPCVVALVLVSALTMGLRLCFGITTVQSRFAPDWRSLLVLFLLVAVHLGAKRFLHKAPTPIVMILLSAGLGLLFWGL